MITTTRRRRRKSKLSLLFRFKRWLKNLRPISKYQKFGLLYGEIIWYKHLCNYTENNLIENLVTEDERLKYHTLTESWYKNKTSNSPSNEYWVEYREYTKELFRKYFPASITYKDWTFLNIASKKDISRFFDGINTYLWNTDECCYVCTQEDIKLKKYRGTMRNSYLEITFVLGY